MATARTVTIAPKLPANEEAESAVIGSIMLSNQVMDQAAILKAEDFSDVRNAEIFGVMVEMFDGGEPIDIVTLSAKLGKNLEKVGGVQRIAKFTSGLPKTSNIGSYLKIVRRKAMMRRVIEIGAFMQEAVFAGEEESVAEQSAENLQDVLNDYADKAVLGRTSRTSKISSVKKMEEKKSMLRVHTGISDLDKYTGGFRAGELVTITASATGSGKTLFAQQIRTYSCGEGFHGIYFSGEMPAEELVGREMATETGIPHWKVRRPENLTKEEYSALVKNAMGGCDVCRIVDTELSIRGIRTACRRMKAAGQLSWAIIDYDELVDAPGKDEFAQQRIVIREAKRIAMTLDIPVFMISGIRKALDSKEAKKPMLERIYGSGAKSKHSSFVLFVDRQWVRELKGDETQARICILKSRSGKIGEVPAKFNLHTLRFEDAELEKPKDRDYTQEPEDS